MNLRFVGRNAELMNVEAGAVRIYLPRALMDEVVKTTNTIFYGA